MTLKIITVCGVGMGSSLLLRMYTEDVLRDLGVDAKVEASDATQARGARVDLILTSPALVEVCSGGNAPVRAIKSFINKAEIRAVLEAFISERG
jgi:PTS system ascorbate-specific IIB component